MPNQRSILRLILKTCIAVFVLGIFVLLYGIFGHPCATGPAKVITTKATLKTLHGAVNMFKLDTGRYPSKERGLIELVREPVDVTGWNPEGYLESTEVPRDVWKNEFVYIYLGRDDLPFVILSFGADGCPGGTGYNADLYSTDMQ